MDLYSSTENEFNFVQKYGGIIYIFTEARYMNSDLYSSLVNEIICVN